MQVAVFITLLVISNALHLDNDKPKKGKEKAPDDSKEEEAKNLANRLPSDVKDPRLPPASYNMGSLHEPTNHKKDAVPAKLWLNYAEVSSDFADHFKVPQLVCGNVTSEEPMLMACQELAMGLKVMLKSEPKVVAEATESGALILDLTDEKNRQAAPYPPQPHTEGFSISIKKGDDGKKFLAISSASGPGLVHGAFWLLNLVQRESEELRLFNPETGKFIANFKTIESSPKLPMRIWDLWDNRDRSIERGYAGESVFYFEELPSMLPRYKDYARLLASTGINSIVWNNVNACWRHNEALLKTETIKSMTPLVQLFKNYGIRSFLTPCYESPRLDLPTADPRKKEVAAWWEGKAKELVKEWGEGTFGGFMFKADSEGQPGPAVYKVPEISGANMMAKALDSVGAIVIWRAFSHPGRADQDQYLYQVKRFSAWEGKTRDNIVLQMKYGAGDFQSTEPVHALFGKLPSVNKIMEIQATQEYTGQAKHLTALYPMWKKVLDFDTHLSGKGSTVAKVLTGQMKTNPSQRIFTGIAAVSNMGNDKTWTGHPMSAANSYAAGRLAWDPSLNAEDITSEWVELTFGKEELVSDTLVPMMMKSLDVWQEFTAPLGWGWHTGKAKLWNTQHYYMDLSAHNWMFMRAEKDAIGFQRTCPIDHECYNNYYNEGARELCQTKASCPDNLLLHFHKVGYDYKLHDNRTVGDAIYEGYEHGAAESAKFVDEWNKLEEVINTKATGLTFAEIKQKLVQASIDARGFAKNGTEWFKTTRSGGVPQSFVRDEAKLKQRAMKSKLKHKKH